MDLGDVHEAPNGATPPLIDHTTFGASRAGRGPLCNVALGLYLFEFATFTDPAPSYHWVLFQCFQGLIWPLGRGAKTHSHDDGTAPAPRWRPSSPSGRYFAM